MLPYPATTPKRAGTLAKRLTASPALPRGAQRGAYTRVGKPIGTRLPVRPRVPRLGGDTVQAAPERPAASDIGYTPQAFTGGTGGYDVGSDPAVARMAALSGRMRAEAQASAAAKRKQAAIEYGDATGVAGIDAATAEAAKNNPYSILGSMKHAYDVGLGDLEEGLNKGNLFYSGYRGQQLGEAANTYQQNRYDAGTRFQGLLTDISDQLAAALLNADMMDAESAGGSDGGYYDPGYYDDYGYGEEPAAAAAAGAPGKPKAKIKGPTDALSRAIMSGGYGKFTPAAARKAQAAVRPVAKPKPAVKAKAAPKKPAPKKPAKRR